MLRPIESDSCLRALRKYGALMALQLTIACGDYDRTHPLIDGSIKPEGIELNWLVLPHLEIWTRRLNYYDFDASEFSLSSYIPAKTTRKSPKRRNHNS